MRLLFFLEPFPVRGHPLQFLWVFERWHQLARSLEPLGVSCTFATSDALYDARAGAHPRMIRPKQLDFSPTLPEDPCELDAQWVRLMKDPCSPWREFVERLLDQTRPDAIVSWTVNAPLRAAAKERRLPLLHQELGPIRLAEQAMYFFDPCGLNGASAIPELWASIRKRPLSSADDEQLDRFIDEFLSPGIPTPNDLARTLGLDPARSVLAVFLQVSRDSNVLAWSRVAGNQGLLAVVAGAIDPAKHQVLVKAHPYEPIAESEIKALGFQCVPIEVSSLALVGVADAVFTINSSVGLEALAHGKQVFTFGASPYSGLGCTRDFGSDPAPLRRALATGAFRPSAKQRTLSRRLLHWMVFRYLATDAELEDADSFVARLEHACELAARGAGFEAWFPPAAPLITVRDVRARRALMAAKKRERLLQEQASEADRALFAARERLTQLDAAREADRAEATGALEARDFELAELRAQLEGIRGSLGVRLLESVRRVPGLYPAYLRGKRWLRSP